MRQNKRRERAYICDLKCYVFIYPCVPGRLYSPAQKKKVSGGFGCKSHSSRSNGKIPAAALLLSLGILAEGFRRYLFRCLARPVKKL